MDGFSTELLMESASLFGFFLVIGAATGFASGLIGVGGGALLAPTLYLALEALGYDSGSTAHAAVASALAVVAIHAMAGWRARIQTGVASWASLRRYGPWFALGGAIGGLIAGFLPGDALAMIIGLGGFIAALLMIFGEGGRGKQAEWRPSAVASGAMTVGVGVASALSGLGGGAFAAPLMRALGVPSAKATVEAVGAGLALAAAGAITLAAIGLATEGAGPPFAIGHVNVAAAVLIAPMAMAAAPLGAQIALVAPQRVTRLFFAFILAMIAMVLIRKAGGA